MVLCTLLVLASNCWVRLHQCNYHIFFICSSRDEHPVASNSSLAQIALGHPCTWPLVDCMEISWVNIPRKRISGSWDILLFNLSTQLQIKLRKINTHLHPINSPHSYQYLVLPGLLFFWWCRYKIVSYCVNLHLGDHQ